MRMKKILWSVLFLPLLAYGQKITVLETVKLVKNESGYFCNPKFSPDGLSLFFTSSNFRGLWQINLESGVIKKITDDAGAGFNPQILNQKVVFRAEAYVNGRKYTSLKSVDLGSGSESVMIDRKRHLDDINLLKDDTICYTLDGKIHRVQTGEGIPKTGGSYQDRYLIKDNTKLVIVESGRSKNMTPLGRGNYIWASLSPDQTKLLFTVAGRGTYISDLSGNIIYDFGYANAPQWSPDGAWIAYMDDKDDGHRFLASDIYACSTDGKMRFKLTNSEQIAMYPSWSRDGNKIAFNSDAGEIYLLTLEIKP